MRCEYWQHSSLGPPLGESAPAPLFSVVQPTNTKFSERPASSKKNKQSNLKECTSGLALQSTSGSSVASLLLTGWAQFTFFLRGRFTLRGGWLSSVGSVPVSSGL